MSITTFAGLIASPDSRKVFLVEIEPSQELTDWTVHAGSIYYQDIGAVHVQSVEQDGIELTEVTVLADVSAGEWFYDDETMRVYVQVSSGSIFSKTIAASYKLYFSNNTDSDAEGVVFSDRFYEPFVLAVPSIRQKKIDLFWGISVVADGKVSLANDDGYFDDWYNDLAWNNKPITVLLGGEDLPYSEYSEMFKGIIFDKHLSTGMFDLAFVDKKHDLTDSLPESTFSLTAFPNMEAQHVGQPVPLVFGTVYNIPSVCVTGDLGSATSLHTFKFADTSLGSVQAITQVYVNSVARTHSSADLDAATFKLATSLFSVGDIVTLDAGGYLSGTTALENPVDVVKKLLAEKDIAYNSTNFDTATMATARSDATNFPIGLVISQYESVIDVVGRIMKSCLGTLFLNNAGKYAITIWSTDLPETPSTVSELDIIQKTLKVSAKVDEIRKTVRIGWRKNWTDEAWAYKQDSSDTTEHVYGITRSRTVQTLLSSEAGVDIYLARMKIMLENATTEIRFSTKLPLAGKNIGDRIEVSFKRREADDNISWLDGRSVEILELDKDFTRNVIKVVADDLKGIGGNVGHWTADPPSFPATLGGEEVTGWDSSWSDAKAAYAKNHWGFWTDTDGFADPADSRSYLISRWW